MKKLLLLLLFVGCQTAEPDFSKIKTGMTEKQVVELVGKPKESKEVTMFNAKFLKYENDIVILSAGKVTRVEKSETLVNEAEELNKNIESINDNIEEYRNMEPAN